MKRKALARIRALIEASAGRVHAGTELVTKAGETMERMTPGVERVTDIMDEIASASHEQTRGIEQVDQAIGQMDEVTQQNAAQEIRSGIRIREPRPSVGALAG